MRGSGFSLPRYSVFGTDVSPASALAAMGRVSGATCLQVAPRRSRDGLALRLPKDNRTVQRYRKAPAHEA